MGTSESYNVAEPEGEARKSSYRIVGYYWLLDTVSGRKHAPMSANGSEQWVRTVFAKGKQAPATMEMVTDATASNGPDPDEADFSKASGGCLSRWNVYDRTSHLTAGKPKGGNILFLDGHVEWRKFAEMEHRWFWQNNGDPCFWW
jgi:prepilin-type processing-associated H-X9-DG protein